LGSEFCIVVATGRPSVDAFIAALGHRSSAISTTAFDVSASAVERSARAVMAASVAIIDASIDPVEALDVCRALREQRADLRTGILFCCPHAATPERLRPFLAVGIGSFLDLQLSGEQMLAALRGIAREKPSSAYSSARTRAPRCLTATARASSSRPTSSRCCVWWRSA
jgi:DNA-binding response OmpR family regulator